MLGTTSLTSLHLLIEIDDIVRSDVLNEFHVFIAVKTRHFIADRFVRSLNEQNSFR